MVYQVNQTLLDLNAEIIDGNQVIEEEQNNPPILPKLETNEGVVCGILKSKIEEILNDEEGYGAIDFWLSTNYDITKLEEPANQLYSAAQVITNLLLDNPEFKVVLLSDKVHDVLQGRTRANKYRITWDARGDIYELPSLVRVPES